MSILNIAVVGGGLVGTLEACLLAKRGFKVTLFEGRHDGRHEENYYGRSINLALSHRGINALKRLNFDQILGESAIPMKARMIHSLDGSTEAIPYDPDGRHINSIERALLNSYLLNKAEQEFKVKILFNHKLVNIDLRSGDLFFLVEGEAVSNNGETKLTKFHFDLIVGCDGARSMVRSVLAMKTKLELHQNFIEHGYLELRIGPNKDGSFQMKHNYLHIWPRGNLMMIALPNKDASFTCTLFMPNSVSDQLKDPEEGLKFFRRNFPDSISLIGEEQIKETLATKQAGSLIQIKCKPYHYENKAVLLGDSAHAMVPFYGQGMNCGFEDCLVLDELLDKYIGSNVAALTEGVLAKVLAEYSDLRCSNGSSMCDIAMYNYIEMRDLVNTRSYRMRKKLDNILYKIFPDKWIPLYTMITFSRLPVNECVRRRKQQDKVIEFCLWAGTVALLLGFVWLLTLRIMN